MNYSRPISGHKSDRSGEWTYASNDFPQEQQQSPSTRPKTAHGGVSPSYADPDAYVDVLKDIYQEQQQPPLSPGYDDTSEVITPRPITPTFGCTKETHPHSVGSWLPDPRPRRASW